METVQMNTRIDANVKRAGDEVLHRFGYTASAAVQALWTHLAKGVLPDFLPAKTVDPEDEMLSFINENAGAAIRLMKERCGIALDFADATWEDDEKTLEWAYEEAGLLR